MENEASRSAIAKLKGNIPLTETDLTFPNGLLNKDANDIMRILQSLNKTVSANF